MSLPILPLNHDATITHKKARRTNKIDSAKIFLDANDNTFGPAIPRHVLGAMRAQEAQVNDIGVVKVPLLPAPSFKLDTETIYNALSEQSNIKMVCICSPGNPTGSTVRKEDVNKILSHSTWNGVVILDETSIDYSSKTASLAKWATEWQNLVIV